MLTMILADLVALVGGTVHTMVPGEEPRVATVLIQDGRIQAIGSDLELPPGTERYDVTGKHLVPGLIDALVSFDPEQDALYVAAGVTVVRDVGGTRVRTLAERSPEARDRTPGPSLYTCGAVLDGDPPSSPDAAVLRNPKAASTLLPILFDERVDFLCVQLGLGAEPWRAVIRLAHEHDLDVWGPVPTALTLEEALAGGQDGIHHLDRLLPSGASWEAVRLDDLAPQIAALAASGVPLVPTLNATSLRLVDQSATPLVGLLPLLGPTYEAWWRDDLGRRGRTMDGDMVARGKDIVRKQRELLARLRVAGVTLVPGSGAPHPWLFPGQSLHTELAAWVRAGMQPAEALACATRGAAEALGLGDRHGILAAGRLADVVCSSADPREDLSALATPELVCVRGRVLERKDLDDLLARLAEKQARAREALDAGLDFPPPPIPKGALVLSGLVESRSLDQRIAAERFAAVRGEDGSLILTGRVRYPGDDEVLVTQTLLDGRLAELAVEAHVGGRVLQVEGVWTAERFRIRRTADGVTVGTQSTREHPVCADLGSVTTLLALGQREPSEAFDVLTFHELFEPEAVRWSSELQADGDVVVQTHTSAMVFRFDEHGAPLLFRTKVGQGIVEARLLEAEAYGGSGLPPLGGAGRARAVDAGARR